VHIKIIFLINLHIMIMTDIIHEYFAIFNQCTLRFEIDKSEIL